MARKILLADDSVTAQNMGRKILADAGYEVITVNNGSAALKKISELKPDLVILDVYMPGYSGLEVCQRLKESQDSSRIPVLLTVGKLEPFKPEEAQRVRAEGFIVKPFEASELLSALSKLEDKVVPRSESSKPGRFARAIAAAEEAGRGGRNDASGDDDGWKSRISFPHQKTESEEKEKEKDTDAAAFYNPINRDLRTVVETPAELAAEKAAEQVHKLHQAQKSPEPSVDVAALVPPGLPQDVTPEEVAAIAAAAAQIQMIGSVVKDEPKAAPEAAADQAVASPPALNAEASQENKKPESTQNEKDKLEEPREEPQDMPVTMAAATEISSSASQSGSRWSAVPVALEGDEAMISLDQEMQKAYAAFVAEEVASTSAASLPQTLQSENSPAPAEPEFPVAGASNPEPETLPQPAITADAVQTESAPAAPPVVAAEPSTLSVETASLPEAATAPLRQTEARDCSRRHRAELPPSMATQGRAERSATERSRAQPKPHIPRPHIPMLRQWPSPLPPVASPSPTWSLPSWRLRSLISPTVLQKNRKPPPKPTAATKP